jgi:hypothetical protein
MPICASAIQGLIGRRAEINLFWNHPRFFRQQSRASPTLAEHCGPKMEITSETGGHSGQRSPRYATRRAQ